MKKFGKNALVIVGAAAVNFEYRAPLARETSPTLTEI